MKLIKMLSFLLALSLVLQNTCPYGFAAKTGFVSPQTHDCPCKKKLPVPAKGQASADNSTGPLLYPAFVFSVPDTQTIVLRSQLKTEYVPQSSENYKDPFKEPLIKPPVV